MGKNKINQENAKRATKEAFGEAHERNSAPTQKSEGAERLRSPEVGRPKKKKKKTRKEVGV